MQKNKAGAAWFCLTKTGIFDDQYNRLHIRFTGRFHPLQNSTRFF
jgi:hypothetical protein